MRLRSVMIPALLGLAGCHSGAAPVDATVHDPPPAQPWDGRFDTSRARSMPTVSTAAVAPEGSEPLAGCVRHRGVLTRTRCARCAMPACDECMVTPKGRRRKMCIECAIIESGVRKRRRNG